ncbi:3-oxoacyl-[acyl-carrier protein] reductase [Bradyrhizobium sp. CIR48]|nr:SDR family NAD(P)-dependent oxidoreductase [Bradyrhizobium sp. CIR48]MBB4425422.1 3-oxoacyl-[acyl-carrier protein] reductase [Bradyrhizobium sp. CIR48]
MTEDIRSIAGKTAIVTGAASGMGCATARLFAQQGAKVALTDLDQAACDRAAEAIRAEGARGEVLPLAFNVADHEAIRRVIAEVANRLGGIDIIVNNAGIVGFASIDDPENYEKQWQRCIDVMITPHQRIIREALPHLRRSEAARIVNIASTEGLGATPGDSPYVAVKHAVVGLTRALAVDLGPEGITVNCICPGAIHTGMTDDIPDGKKETFARRRVALRRYGRPEEVAQMTLSLVLPAASYLTGAVIPVDGGLTIRNA